MAYAYQHEEDVATLLRHHPPSLPTNQSNMVLGKAFGLQGIPWGQKKYVSCAKFRVAAFANQISGKKVEHCNFETSLAQWPNRRGRSPDKKKGDKELPCQIWRPSGGMRVFDAKGLGGTRSSFPLSKPKETKFFLWCPGHHGCVRKVCAKRVCANFSASSLRVGVLASMPPFRKPRTFFTNGQTYVWQTMNTCKAGVQWEALNNFHSSQPRYFMFIGLCAFIGAR